MNFELSILFFLETRGFKQIHKKGLRQDKYISKKKLN